MPSPQFVLGTLASAPEGSPTPFVPRVRYCIFRGFWTELPENKHNDAERNPRVYESDLPTFTTDVRMEKVAQIFGSSAGHAVSADQTQGSGGGGPVEAVWWVEETSTQWRVRGRAYVVSDDIEGLVRGTTSGFADASPFWGQASAKRGLKKSAMTLARRDSARAP